MQDFRLPPRCSRGPRSYVLSCPPSGLKLLPSSRGSFFWCLSLLAPPVLLLFIFTSALFLPFTLRSDGLPPFSYLHQAGKVLLPLSTSLLVPCQLSFLLRSPSPLFLTLRTSCASFRFSVVALAVLFFFLQTFQLHRPAYFT